MPRHFSIPTMLRMTSNELLQEFLETLNCRLLCLDWDGLKQRQIEPILNAFRWLDHADQDRIESALRTVFDLACENGLEVLYEIGRHCGLSRLPSSFPLHAGHYDKAMWIWLHYPELFERATTLHQTAQLGWWRKRTDLPSLEPRTDVDALADLARDLSIVLTREQGRGRQCSVEHHRREEGTDYFFAYPDDFVETVNLHDAKGRLTARSVRQTFEIIYAYNRCAGSLELHARVPSRLKRELEDIFGWTILGEELGPRLCGAAYNLNRLKDKRFSFETDPRDRLQVELCRMRIDLPGGGRITLESGRNIHQMLDECIDRKRVPLSRVQVSLATLRCEFDMVTGRRQRTMTFDMIAPNTCNLHNNRPEQVLLVRKYLRQWRIEHV